MAVMEYLINRETIFIGLFLFLFWQQNSELKINRDFIKKQQAILDRLTTRVERIDEKIDMVIEKTSKKVSDRND